MAEAEAVEVQLARMETARHKLRLFCRHRLRLGGVTGSASAGAGAGACVGA